MTNKDIVFFSYLMFWMLGSIICLIFNFNAVIFQICMCIILCLLICLRRNNKIEQWFRSSRNTYYLTEEEKTLWNNICKKAKIGYDEWFAQTQGDDLCGPWIKDIQPEEVDLLDKIHEHFYGKD